MSSKKLRKPNSCKKCLTIISDNWTSGNGYSKTLFNLLYFSSGQKLFNIVFMFFEIRQRRSLGVELVLKNRADAREQKGNFTDFLLNLFY